MSSNTALNQTASIETVKSNIIPFPKMNTNLNHDPAEIMLNLVEMKLISVEDVLGFIIPTFFEALLQAGFEIDDDRLNNLLVAVTRAIMYKHYNIQHPLHSFIDENSEYLDDLMSDQTRLAYGGENDIEFIADFGLGEVEDS